MSKILIIEDDRVLNRGVKFILEKEGYEVISAFTKSEGYQFILKEKIDFLLLDINLPDGSGLDLCKSIRNKYNVTGNGTIVRFGTGRRYPRM